MRVDGGAAGRDVDGGLDRAHLWIDRAQQNCRGLAGLEGAQRAQGGLAPLHAVERGAAEQGFTRCVEFLEVHAHRGTCVAAALRGCGGCGTASEMSTLGSNEGPASSSGMMSRTRTTRTQLLRSVLFRAIS